MRTPGDSATLSTTETSLAVLERVLETDGATLPELVSAFDAPKSTVYGHLATLERHGYLVFEDGEYHVGLKLLRFGEHARTRKPAYERARERVDALVEETGEEAGFLVEENGRAIMIHSATAGPRSAAFVAGRTGYMHDNAAGKAMLAEMDRETVEAVIDRWGLPERTPGTVTDRETLFEELAAVRERGVATTEEEYTEGLCAVGAAVLDPDGDVFGAVSLGVPTFRADAVGHDGAVADAVRRTADAIEADLAAGDDGSDVDG